LARALIVRHPAKPLASQLVPPGDRLVPVRAKPPRRIVAGASISHKARNMDKDLDLHRRFAKLTPPQIDVLRLYHARWQIKAIAAELGVSPSTVDQRLGRARRILGAHNSLHAARLWADHDHARTLSVLSAYGPNALLPSSPIGQARGIEAVDDGLDGARVDEAQRAGGVSPDPTPRSFGWPLPTRGRRNNDLSSLTRLAWIVPIAVLALIILLVIALLTIDLQDILNHRI
jgi:DNA-binding CsgD family transcriptional regulator